MPIKKSVRLVDPTIKLCHELTPIEGDGFTGDKINWSGSINAMAEYFKIFAGECLPELTPSQKNTFYCAYNGYISGVDLSQEIKMLPWNISEGYQYDEQIREFLGTEKKAAEFIERIKNWSDGEKLAVIYMAKSYWRQGQISEGQ